MNPNKTYRNEDWNIHHTFDKLLEILGKHKEIDTAREIISDTQKHQEVIANLEHIPTEVQKRIIKFHENLTIRLLEDEEIRKRSRTGGLFGLGPSNPLEEASQKAWEQTDRVFNRFLNSNDLAQSVLSQSAEVLENIAKKLGKLLEGSDIKEADKKELNRLKDRLFEYSQIFPNKKDADRDL